MQLFSDAIRQIAGGSLNQEAGEALAALVHAVDDQGKGGELVLRLKLKPGGYKSGTLNVSYQVDCKKPVAPPTTQTMWPTPEGNLLPQDPRQQELNLTIVNSDTPPQLKSVNQ